MKTLIFSLCIIVSSFAAKAQAGYHFGITMGVYNTWIIDKTLSDDPNYDYPTFGNNKWRFSPVGIEIGHNFSDNSGVQIEAIVAKQGQVFDIVDVNDEKVGTKEIDLTYIHLPLLFKAIGGENMVKFTFKLGPQVSFLRKGTDIEIFKEVATLRNNRGACQSEFLFPVITLPGEYICASTNPDDAPFGFNTIDLGIAFDLGVEVEIVAGFYVSALVRFNYGFFDIRDDEYIENIENITEYSPSNNAKGGFQFGVHYIIEK